MEEHDGSPRPHTPGPEPCKLCAASGRSNMSEGVYHFEGCGCRTIGAGNLPHPFAVSFCPMHATAPMLLQVAEDCAARRCDNDPINPCWDGRSGDVPGLHWGGGRACAPCTARAVLADIKAENDRAKGDTPQ